MRLLIADDEAVIRKGLVSLDWKSIGITDVYSAANGLEAKDLLLSDPVDIVIFDIRMPGFTGLELAQMVKERSLDVAVVLLSGFAEFEYARSAMHCDVYEYLLKPIAPDELIETIRRVKQKLELRRQEKQFLVSQNNYTNSLDLVNQIISMFVDVPEPIKTILVDIAENYSQNISLKELGEIYHFSESYLSRKIKKDTGYSFVEILNAIRLTSAANMLRQKMRITDVCEKAGFNDVHYFSQLFKRTFGCSPSGYRAEDRQEYKFYQVLNQEEKAQ